MAKVKFMNLVSWAGVYFCAKPNEIIDLDEETAKAREKLKLGRIILDKSKRGASEPIKAPADHKPKVEPAPKPEPPKEG